MFYKTLVLRRSNRYCREKESHNQAKLQVCWAKVYQVKHRTPKSLLLLGMCVEIKGQLYGVSFLLPPFCGVNRRLSSFTEALVSC